MADGTYATETAYSSAANARLDAVRAAAKPPLRGGYYDIDARMLMRLITDDMVNSALVAGRFLHRRGVSLNSDQARPPIL